AIYGAGGFGKEVACIINEINIHENNKWNLIGFFDDGIEIGSEISHFGKVIGGIEKLNNWESELYIVFAIGTPKIIKKIISNIDNLNVYFPNIIHPEVKFADLVSFSIGKGNVIVRGCTFSVDVTIGDFNQFNSISALAHDVIVGSFNVLMPLTRISGEVNIGNCNFFGINAIVLQGIKIGDYTRIGAGSVLMKKTKDNYLYFGNPAKKMDI
ncbi:MAG: serine acetyltransferase, partial [Mariniphaga sp.]|nr:serine acetyltransferase [Mariniphaga sp.]